MPERIEKKTLRDPAAESGLSDYTEGPAKEDEKRAGPDPSEVRAALRFVVEGFGPSRPRGIGGWLRAVLHELNPYKYRMRRMLVEEFRGRARAIVERLETLASYDIAAEGAEDIERLCRDFLEWADAEASDHVDFFRGLRDRLWSDEFRVAFRYLIDIYRQRLPLDEIVHRSAVAMEISAFKFRYWGKVIAQRELLEARRRLYMVYSLDASEFSEFVRDYMLLQRDVADIAGGLDRAAATRWAAVHEDIQDLSAGALSAIHSADLGLDRIYNILQRDWWAGIRDEDIDDIKRRYVKAGMEPPDLEPVEDTVRNARHPAFVSFMDDLADLSRLLFIDVVATGISPESLLITSFADMRMRTVEHLRRGGFDLPWADRLASERSAVEKILWEFLDERSAPFDDRRAAAHSLSGWIERSAQSVVDGIESDEGKGGKGYDIMQSALTLMGVEMDDILAGAVGEVDLNSRLADLVDSVLKLNTARLRAKRMNVDVGSIDPTHVPLEMRADLVGAIDGFVQGAIEAADLGSRDRRVDLLYLTDGPLHSLVVKDNGRADRDLRYAMNPPAGERRGGLARASRIARRRAWNLSIESTRGAGTTAVLTMDTSGWASAARIGGASIRGARAMF